MKTLRIKLLSENATIPTRHNPTDSGLDIYAAEDVIIEPGETAIVKTDIAIELASGYEAQVRPRSGITYKTKLRVQLGTVDADFRGNVGIIVDNISHYVSDGSYGWAWSVGGYPIESKNPCLDGSYLIRKGDKLAQLVVVPVELPDVEVVDELNYTARGNNGFGSSGTGV